MEQQDQNKQGQSLRNAALETANSILVLRNRQEQQLLQTQAELRKALEEVRRAEAEFSAAFEFAPIGMALVGLSGEFVRVNKSFCNLLGYTSDELQQRTVLDITHPDDLEVSLGYQNRLRAGKQDSYQIEKRYLAKTGVVIWVSLSVSLIKNPDGSPKHTIAQLMDVTDSRAAQEALRRSGQEAGQLARHYKFLLDSQSVYIVKTDTLGNYTYANDYYCREFGFHSDLTGTWSMANILEEDHSKCLATAQSCFLEPEVAHEVILKKLTTDGKILGGKWEFKGMLNKAGEVSEILCVGFDITDQLENIEYTRHLLEVSSEQNSKLRSFAQIVSHNLRSHSANFAGILSLMDEATAEDKDTYIAMLNEGSAQLEQTIRNLNEIITVNDNAIEPKERRCLQEEVVKALRTLNGLILKHQIGVNVSIGENLYVYAIPAYLDSILLNLISNAIKYRSPDRLATVDIFAGQEANYTFLAVQDNGLGLDLNRHGHKLFGLYKKFHGNTDARGFGLYITKTQVEAMGGRIEVASEVGKGSIFKVYFHEKN